MPALLDEVMELLVTPIMNQIKNYLIYIMNNLQSSENE